MGADFTIGQLDDLPVFEYQLISPNGGAPNLSGCTVNFEMGLAGQQPIVSASATVVNSAEGQVSFTFTPADTAVAGVFNGRFVVNDGAGGIETYPNDGPLMIQVTANP